jgi:hypothetical protein
MSYIKDPAKNSMTTVSVTEANLQRGASLQWVSAFASESEILFCPLTFLQPTGNIEVVEVEKMRFTVVEVIPTTA